MLTGAPQMKHEITARPPVLLVHGSQDPVVPVSVLHEAETALKPLDVDVQTHVSPGVGHSVDPVGLRLGRDFVARSLGL